MDFAPLPPPAPAAPPQAKAGVVVPAGNADLRSNDRQHQRHTTASSQRYRASIEDPIAVGDRVIIPKGANCTVQVVQVEGGKELDLKLYEVQVAGKIWFATSITTGWS